jgi:CRP-like cAMP-binding protein
MEECLNITIEETIAGSINDRASFVSFSAKQIVLLEGMKSANLYLIIHGIVRGYYIDDKGNDVTKCFSSENEFFSSEGLRTAGISSFTIECLEDCQCVQLPYSLINNIIKKDENLKAIFTKYCLKEVEKLEKRAKILALMSAEERYVDFYTHFPHLHERVDLKHIASYLGIRAASLSRIRKGMRNTSLD